MNKPTNRIRQDGAAKAAKSQAKTTRNHKPKAVRIIINDNADQPFVDFELPEPMFASIQRDAQSKGISTIQWIEEATREHLKKFAPVANPPAPAQPAEFLIPSQVAIEAEDALSILEAIGNATGALVMMNADQIKYGLENDGGWESLDVPGFGEGALELARSIFSDFQHVFSETERVIHRLAGQLKDATTPVGADSRQVDFTPIRALYGYESWDLEEAIGALRSCVLSQGMILSNRHPHGNQVEHFPAMAFNSKLEAALESFWDAQNKLHLVFLTLTPGAGRRSAVAS